MRDPTTADPRQERIAIVGDGPEFHDLLAELRADAGFLLQHFETLDEFARLPVLSDPPQFLCLLQSRAGQFAQVHVDTLRHLLPDLRWLCVVGSYAEGETRSGHPLRGIERVHWTAALDRFHALRAIWEGQFDHLPVEHLGFGAKAAERMVSLNCGPRPFPHVVGIVAAAAPVAEPLLAACSAAGFCEQWLPSTLLDAGIPREVATSLNLCLWLDEPFQGSVPPPLQTVVARLAPCPVLAVGSFLRVQDRDELVQKGAAAVLARPFVLEDLVGLISRVARPSTLPARSNPGRQAS